MKAVRFDRYGPPEVLQVGELPLPVPGRGEVRVRVEAAGLNPKDVLVRRGKFRWATGRRFPMVPGYDLAGVVDALGPGVRPFRAGDPVYGMIQSWRAGACAEWATVPEGEIAPKPDLDMVEAAAVPLAGLTALQALRDLLHVGPGKEVVLNGASGGVGTFAVQVAKVLGARVVAVSSRANADLLRELGADEVVPYDERPITALGREVDAFLDIFGSAAYPKVKHLLGARGRYVTTIPSPDSVLRDLLTRWTRRPARLVVVRSNRPDLEQLARWIDAGELTPIVDRAYPMSHAAEAQAYLETKRARGKVVIHVNSGTGSGPER